MKKLILLLLLFTSACAPMPGPKLFNGLTHPTPRDEVKITKTVGVYESTVACNSALIKLGNYIPIALNCALNACVVMGCALTNWDANTGVIQTCDVYLAFDVWPFNEHEYLHCEGYDDVLY